MRTEAEVVVGPGAGGVSTLVVAAASGALAVRRTGARGGRTGGARAGAPSGSVEAPLGVHLVATAAGPLGGDVVDVRVRVLAGASLRLRSVAATLALPRSGGGLARTCLDVVVEDGAHADVELGPTVVAAGADVVATTTARVDGTGTLVLTERVQLGRHHEAPGRWRGHLDARRGGRPWLVQRVGVGPGASLDDAIDAPRALLSRLSTDDAPAGAAMTRGSAARLPLARGGTLVEATGPDLGAVAADVTALAGAGEGIRTAGGG